jgi:Bifunctional DNA primase/polymerase, N-terminal
MDDTATHPVAALAALEAQYGALPATLAQTTRSGGRHLFFAYHPDARQSTHWYGEYLDGRNDGGYVVLPPSRVVEGDGEGRYTWGTATFDDGLVAMPPWSVSVKIAG